MYLKANPFKFGYAKYIEIYAAYTWDILHILSWHYKVTVWTNTKYFCKTINILKCYSTMAKSKEISPLNSTRCITYSNHSSNILIVYDRGNFIYSIFYFAVFVIIVGNSIDTTEMFSLLLSSTCMMSRLFVVLTPTLQWPDWGCTRRWEGTQPGQATLTIRRMSYAMWHHVQQ